MSRLTIPGETVAAAFLNQAFGRRRMLIVADDLAGGVTYERLVVGASAMAARFRAIAAPNVGLMLPASVACDLAFLGLHLAGKLPVVLNWTTGPANLAHAVKLMGLTHVVTSKAFIDRVQVEVPGAKFVFLEDVRGQHRQVRTAPPAARGALVRRRGSRTGCSSRLSSDPHKPARVCCSPAAARRRPKAVPLTHANIITDQRACVEALKIAPRQLRARLPADVPQLRPDRHRPVAAVRRRARSSTTRTRPTPARSSARSRPTSRRSSPPRRRSWGSSSTAPSRATSTRCASSSSARRSAPSICSRRRRELAPNAEVLEGYGITECSPVVSVNRPGHVKPGTIGEPLPGVEVCVTDLETKEVLPRGKMGMLHVAGPTVFPGYLGPRRAAAVRGDRRQAVVRHRRPGGARPDGRHRLPRPAEAVPEGGRRDDLAAGAGGAVRARSTRRRTRARAWRWRASRRPTAAGSCCSRPSRSRCARRTRCLQQEGFRGVMRLDEVKKLDKLPVLGTGKTDYKVLRAMIESDAGTKVPGYIRPEGGRT